MITKDRIVKWKESESYRLIAISDIHGGFHLYKKLIDKIGLRESDYLVIIGDFVEKGEYNKEVLDEMKRLSKRDKTVILSGNCESYISSLLLEEDKSKNLLRYLNHKPYRSIIDDWILKSGIRLEDIYDGITLQWDILKDNKEDIEFLSSLPIGVEFDDFLFAHGGIGEENTLENTKYGTLLASPEFYKKGHNSEKTVIVGHWPTSNYKEYSNNGDVIIDREKRIISIDGGYGVKIISQLNGLIIEKYRGEYTISSESVNEFKKYIVKEYVQGTKELPEKIAWPNHSIEVIEKGKEFSLCKRLDNGEYVKVKNELIFLEGDKYYCSGDYQEYFLTVNSGEEIEVVNIYGEYALAKYKGEFGWIEVNKISLVQ